MLDVGESWSELPDFDDNHGHVVGEGAVAPRCCAVKNGLPHFRKCPFGRLTHQRFQTVDAELFLAAVVLTMHGWTAKHYVISAVIILVVMGMFAYSWS